MSVYFNDGTGETATYEQLDENGQKDPNATDEGTSLTTVDSAGNSVNYGVQETATPSSPSSKEGNYLIDNKFKSKNQLGYACDKWSVGYVGENDGIGLIYPFPKNIYLYYDDISYDTPGVDYNQVYDIPKIRIREYVMDLPEDKWIDILQETFSQMEGTFKSYKTAGVEAAKLKVKTFAENFDAQKVATMFGDKVGAIKSKDNQMKLAYDIPRWVYRKLISYDTTHLYELPYGGSIHFSSSGGQGWENRNMLNGIKLISQLNINRVPNWKYGGQESDTIEFELNLFNDTYTKAFNNFNFIHTIVPNNMWLQHGFFQHNPSSYDIQMSGGLRYFCCSLDIKCEYVGNVRTPPQKFVTEMIENTSNQNAKAKLASEGFEICKIPDVFKLTFSFKSLLPNNFNQYLMTYNETDGVLEMQSQTTDEAKISKAWAETITALG